MRPTRRLARLRRPVAAATVTLIVGLLVGGGAARAQTSGTPMTPDQLEAQFGGFSLTARAAGLSLSYNSPGLIPGTPSPLIQVSLPESTTNSSNGPSGYALSSLLYPGALLADLSPLAAQLGYDVAIPGYPVRAQAFYPAGPTTADESVGASSMHVVTTETGTTSQTVYGAAQLAGILNIGAITTSSSTDLEEGQVVSRSRVALEGIDLMAGLIHIDGLVTDLVANSNGTDAATAGNTTVSGATLLGLPITIDGNGVRFASTPPAATGTTVATPTTASPLGPLGKVLGSVSGSLAPVAKALSSIMTTALGAGTTDLGKLLSLAGINLKVLAPIETKSGAQIERLANALQLTLSYDGKTTPLMSQLLALIPSASLPSKGIPGIPIPNSPQALVEILKATHIVTLGAGLGDVTAVATSAYSASNDNSSAGAGGSSDLGSSDLGSSPSDLGSGDTGGFTTPTPALSSGAGKVLNPRLASDRSKPLLIGLLIALLLAAALLAWALSTRLADYLLAAQGTSCPDGLDRPPPGGG